MRKQAQFKLVSSTVAGPRKRTHKSCPPGVRLTVYGPHHPDCCETCGQEFIPDHPQLSELEPMDCEAFDQKLATMFASMQKMRIVKKRTSGMPKRTIAAKTKGRPA
ncbi:MAG: hypothetical protein A3C02_02620 [Candidatus Andersenbacteria bacterium RIFCSPHIGHO2_02_FULL_45_11]|uniref:Uncharacterized protein n=1 Tax=Candidatus Andersenbacteria bacterium RIFCSPHIGHO2_12_FULL_45_11 TaxID=1797281 RepID=A0A1G1X5L7_9BACT|nr:MAG: hypothetical protein A3C02_02620 [Candidatus Andersenbacteria bacterium RIFCSPHIGHO2_02_FULL_45_11]OGY35263.1 MAG: hypothetical protein A3D99_01180 [Candidatus Andersenbacteria bacterium RIFCSPHIGHO2_12_FULL_45_11]